ncbi:Protein METABOLIC NETWORK MODULATOR 1 [Cardamine amara subsp. amara]|uniref:Protein METABOLIC NETWORK MODULATOR 1 n=1 Tax=Cardamine amara subsp. amara TaxID=228776 RepID=A0ABD1AIB8_CARAN
MILTCIVSERVLTLITALSSFLQEMDNNHTVSGDSMAKRKRGRPRKHLKMESNVQSIGSPPGFSMTQPQIRQRDEDEAMVGQQIHGVIEATFEAGFLVSVKFENSDSVFRGLVFKPGRCDPVSVDNDIAPHLPMIRRNSDVVLHHGSANGGGRKSRVRQRRGSGVRSRSRVPVPIQPAHPMHHAVPVVLPPRQNGGGQVPIQPPHPVVPVKHQPAHLQNGGGQVPVNHGPMQTETGSQASGSGNGKPFETLLTEVMNKGKVHQTTESIEADEPEEQALSIEPLQAIHPVHPVHMPKPVPSYGRGNMTELLQAVQENVKETHFAEGQ